MIARLIAAACLLLAAVAGAASAQTMPPNEAGVTMGHWHLNSRDIAANQQILVAMGGTAIKAGPLAAVRFPGVIVILQLPGTPAPATGGTVGTVVNHVGFSVPDVQQAVARWKAAGVPVEPGANGRTNQAFVTTPDGFRMEILEDKDQTVPIRSHHVHFFVPEAAIPQIQAWYAKIFGAKPGMRGRNQSDDVPGANLTFTKTDAPTVGTKGRVLDHIGFDVKNLQEFCKNLEAQGIVLDVPYTKNPNVALAFIHDPWGTSIELNERPNPL
jgi:catechol 2,3-dioxygenase-like lactoylglutathione lyase family enzyme